MRDLLAYCRHILLSLHAHGFPEAIVAGGAIRDLDNGRADTVKDIDIVVFDRPNYLADLLMAMWDFKHKVAVREEVANYLAFENVCCVHEFTDPYTFETPPPVQVVVARHPRTALEILQRHDFGLCQIGYDGYSIIKTAAYEHDKLNGWFTLVRCRDAADYKRSHGRHARLSLTKYAGYPMRFDGPFTP
jgi:hypothetical protein